ncbi:DUF4880 domain-containing protein [Exilibacterium tricleocarpae]|uniref:DUF4880 domain-containing protein n=1 Tax=Exilibacterium tricleocarpae TaxID=2591008 RepID=A0A545TNU2_9GAMM|nr:FecR domain-containing protein [Exilibacterium tricleocarpae]TQV78890.1 DUF4880 domain-containing protein [Exilibacterium tricleocarpae]
MSAGSPSDREVRRAAAAHWFNEHRAGDMTEADKRLFAQWLCQAPENRAAYRQMERDWALFGAVAQDPQILAAREQDRCAFDRPSHLQRVALIAASVLLALTTSWAVIDSGLTGGVDFDRPAFTSRPEATTYRTSLGQHSTFTLPDGSSVTLDTDSELRVGTMRELRKLQLVRGRAFFNVAKDPSRPFIVYAGDKTVRALGTAFQVSMEGEDVTVTLVEGSVRVEEDTGLLRPNYHRVDMQEPGGQLSAPEDSNWIVEQVDVQVQTSWLNGHLVFLSDPLADAVAEINRYSSQKIVFTGNRIPEREILGVFRTGDVGSFVRALELDGIAKVVSRNDVQIELRVQ